MAEEPYAGGGSGFGAGIAKAFAEQGARVMVADINEIGGRRTAEHRPPSIRFHKANVTEERDWKLLLEATQDAFGGVECLVNNAGTTYKNKVAFLSPVLTCLASALTRCQSRLQKSQRLSSTDASMSMSRASSSARRLSYQRSLRRGEADQSSTLRRLGRPDLNLASCGITVQRAPSGMYVSGNPAWWNRAIDVLELMMTQATKGLAAEYGPHKIRINSVCPLLGGTGL